MDTLDPKAPCFTPVNYPTVGDGFSALAEAIQAQLFQADKGTPHYVDLCQQLDGVRAYADECIAAGIMDEPASVRFNPEIVAVIPAWPSTNEELAAKEAADTATIDRDLEYAAYYAHKARVCSTDAVLAQKVGRADIAQQLRRMRDVYKHKARHLYCSVVYGNLFFPFGGV